MKTPHNVMRAVLDDDEYANFCAAWQARSAREQRTRSPLCFEAAERGRHPTVLMWSFVWDMTAQGHKYWQTIYNKLRK